MNDAIDKKLLTELYRKASTTAYAAVRAAVDELPFVEQLHILARVIADLNAENTLHGALEDTLAIVAALARQTDERSVEAENDADEPGHEDDRHDRP